MGDARTDCGWMPGDIFWLCAERDRLTAALADMTAERDVLAAERATFLAAMEDIAPGIVDVAESLGLHPALLDRLREWLHDDVERENDTQVAQVTAERDSETRWAAQYKEERDRLAVKLEAESKARAAFQMYGMMWEQSEAELAETRETLRLCQQVANDYQKRACDAEAALAALRATFPPDAAELLRRMRCLPHLCPCQHCTGLSSATGRCESEFQCQLKQDSAAARAWADRLESGTNSDGSKEV